MYNNNKQKNKIMEVGQTVFKEIIKNLKPLDSVIGDECLQSVVKSFTLTIYSNENTEFSIDECGTFINKKHVGYDLTNEQIEVLKELLKLEVLRLENETIEDSVEDWYFSEDQERKFEMKRYDNL